MNFKINYGTDVGVFPTSCAEHVKRATVMDLRVLWFICAEHGDIDTDRLCTLAGASESEVLSSVSYWHGAGVIDTCEEKAVKSTPLSEKSVTVTNEKSEKVMRTDELPIYTTDELSNLLEQNLAYESYISECQKIMGKMFNVHEVNVLVGLIDYLNLDFEYVMILLTYCISHGKKTLHYVEKTAFNLYNDGITSADALTAELKRREEFASVEGNIRKLFGMGQRTLTTKEKRIISSWVNDMGFSMEMIEKAYEVTADATGNASIPYTNSVLERWNSDGIKTIAGVEESEQKHKALKQGKKKPADGGKAEASKSSSFNTDEFFKAAVRRSLGGDKK